MVCNKCNSRGDSYCEYCQRYTGLCSNCYDKHHKCREKHDASVEVECNVKVEPNYSASVEKLQDTFAIEQLQRRNSELSQQLSQLDEMYQKIKVNYEENIAYLKQKVDEALEAKAQAQDTATPNTPPVPANNVEEQTPNSAAIEARIDENIKTIKKIKKKMKAEDLQKKYERLSKGKSATRLNNIAE